MKVVSIRQLMVIMLALVALFTTTGSALAQPAPGLTQYRVIAVTSPQFQATTGQYWDGPIQQGAIATPGDHGGAWLAVVVYEQGYANGQYSTFNGAPMSLYYSQPLVNYNNQIYGYYRYYYIQQQFTSGTFRSSANSIGYPFGTRSTSFYIR